jgi:AcrR family transcriptional regulator
VADIVAEAGTSNQAFYRYFAGKDDLMRAVFERGIDRVASYLEHQIAKHDEPAAQVEAWIRGVLTQVTNRPAARQSAAVNLQLGGRPSTDDAGFPAALRGPLHDAVALLGSTDPERDSSAIGELVFSVLNRHIRHATAPSATDCDHLVAFCLRAVNA